ncbi:MAG: DUF4397 domain-containing protein [Clostridia bacterium]|nr:DUF4397 domain-containing protein [Clostridia bacterium]
MLISPQFLPEYSYFMPREANSYIRILHASPDALAVDVYANNRLIARNLPYRGFTPYLKVPAGNYNIRVLPAGQISNPVLIRDIVVPDRSIYTIAAIGRLSEIDLLPVQDPLMPRAPGKARVRFVHLSPNAPAVDIVVPNGTVLFGDIQYMEISEYITVNTGRYTIYVKLTGTNQIVLYVPNIRLLPGKNYTVYAVGFAGGNPPLQVLIPLDGNSYIKL